MMKPFHVGLALAGATLTLSGCSASPGDTHRKVVISYTGQVLQDLFGTYQAQPERRTACAPALPHGYSKDDAGYRTAPLPTHRQHHGPTPTGYVVKTYRIGPHADPANPRIVQGAHTVYQVVGQPGWNLHTVHRVTVPMAPAPALPEASPQLMGEANRKAQEAEETATRLQRRVDALEQAQKANTAAVNDNQQLLVDQINQLKGQQGKPGQATQADPSFPHP
jgi:hypothetical protein